MFYGAGISLYDRRVAKSNKSWIHRQQKDPYAKQARASHYRSRAAFKLSEIDKKDKLFRRGQTVVDVGASPGSWSQYASEQVGPQGRIIAVDILPMQPIDKVLFIKGDFTEDESHSLVEVKDDYEFWKSGDEKLLRKLLIPVEYAIPHVKKIFVKDSAVDALCNGAPLYPNGATRIQKDIVRGETMALITSKEELIALGIAKMTSEEIFKRKTGIAVRIDRVLIERGTYPKWDKP